MSITIVATAGGAASNSFITEAEAISYMAARLNATAWTTVSGASCTEDEKKALIEATRELSARAYVGYRADDTQVLSWPRQWAHNPDSPIVDYFALTCIPKRIKDATAELAFQFLNAGTTDVASLDPNIGVIESTIDVITTKYADPYDRAQGLARYPRVMNYIRPLLANSSSVTVPMVRG